MWGGEYVASCVSGKRLGSLSSGDAEHNNVGTNAVMSLCAGLFGLVWFGVSVASTVVNKFANVVGYIYIYIYIHIQGVTGGTDQISGACSLC